MPEIVDEIVFGVTKAGGGCYGGSGSCSLKWLRNMYGTYNEKTRKYVYRAPEIDFAGYKSAVMCFTSESQEKGEGLLEGLQKAGFIRLGGVRSAHGTYNCTLWLLEPRAGEKDQYNEGDAYRFYPNPEVFEGAPGCGGTEANSKLVKGLQAELAESKDQLGRARAAQDLLDKKLQAADAKIAELKTAAAERRLLKRTQRTTSSAGTKKGASALLHSGVRKPKGVRMGGRNAL